MIKNNSSCRIIPTELLYFLNILRMDQFPAYTRTKNSNKESIVKSLLLYIEGVQFHANIFFFKKKEDADGVLINSSNQ
jgi:hypothetical protein